MCMGVFNVFPLTWRSSKNHNTGRGHILVGSEPVHSSMLTFNTLTSDGRNHLHPEFRHTIIHKGVNKDIAFFVAYYNNSVLNIPLNGTLMLKECCFNFQRFELPDCMMMPACVISSCVFLQCDRPVPSRLAPEN